MAIVFFPAQWLTIGSKPNRKSRLKTETHKGTAKSSCASFKLPFETIIVDKDRALAELLMQRLTVESYRNLD